MRLRLGGVVLSLLLLTGCDFDFTDIGEIFELLLYDDSPDPEVRQVGKDQDMLAAKKQARDAASQFITAGDEASLTKAVTLRPDEPEYRGLSVVSTWLANDRAAMELSKAELLRTIALREKAIKGAVPDPKTLQRLASEEILTAEARMLEASGGIQAPAAGAAARQGVLYANYCRELANHKKTYGANDGFGLLHEQLHPGSCPP